MPENILIGDWEIGVGQPCFIVAEVGLNHNGDFDMEISS
jgi:sialic acid synthase SpsE